MTVEALNTMDRENFVATIGWVFEHSSWVAERAWASRPFRSVDALLGAMVDQVERASADEQLALLRAHPDLGTRARVSDASAAEQAGAGLDQLTSEEFERLLALNKGYRDKFGFPFLFAVKGSTKHDILDALACRVSSSQEEEFRTALAQVYRISRFRIESVLS